MFRQRLCELGEVDMMTKNLCSCIIWPEAESGHFFSGPGRVWAGLFWSGSGSGWPFLATGQFGPPILANFGQILTNFSAKSAIFLVRAGSGHSKPMARGPNFGIGLWPDPALEKIVQ